MERIAGSKDLGRWVTKGFWAVSDQGLFATSNLVLNVLLARWLVPQDYGAFTVAMTVFFLLGTVHAALLTEPMLVFSASRYKGRLSEYLGTLLYGHLGFAVFSGLLLLLVGLSFSLLGSGAVSAVLVALAFTGPFILFLWLMRRACYARREPHLATSGGALYLVLMLAGAYTLYRLEWLSSVLALCIIGSSSLAVSLWLCMRLRVSRPALRDGGIVRETFDNHWRYGRWSVATSALNWVPGNIYFLLLPIWGGLEASASLKALMILVVPALHANFALGTLLLPALAQARGQAKFNSLVRFALIPFILGPVLYWLLLGMLHQPLVAWLYGGQYTEHASLLWLLGLLPIFWGFTAVIGGALRALERPDQLFYAYALSAGVALTLGAGFMLLWGVVGAGLGLLASYITTATVAPLLYQRLKDRNSS